MWIQEEPLILREEGSGTRKEAERLLEKMGIHTDALKIVASIENQETIKRSVSRGVGISIISRLAAEDESAPAVSFVFLWMQRRGSVT
ncbi:LysR substrate-binding domain-containing protein [Muricomes sp. OA1]|uniref:LysR substrate-binding domain-containing protein n=1 Tax=Muricomes sp. OA1 TaxID=2914165 RepID=UPI001F060B2F|nr:LysR substrate-binding domain-containing protein [Muricomes sp. OA1]MCH1970805.1 LysR substrate-binding domain-containing protein [Muricomes sp. OA1]